MRAISALSISDCRRLSCLISLARLSSVSRSPYSPINCAAVFTPMPGTPGTLSVESPISACTSITLSGPTPNFSITSAAADAAVLHGVVHGDAVADELHQVLVGGDDGGGGLGLAGEPRIGGDQVVGLEAGLLEAGNFEGVHRLADQRELRNEVFRRVGPVRLVVGIELGAEGLLRFVEYHGEMRRLLLRLHLGQQLPQHVAEAEHGIDLQAVRLAGQRRQRVIGAEDVAGAVHQEEVVALFQRARRRIVPGAGRRALVSLLAGGGLGLLAA